MKQTGDYITIKRMVRRFLDGKSAFFNGNETDDSDNDDENYNENNSSSSFLRVLPIIATNSFPSSPTRTN